MKLHSIYDLAMSLREVNDKTAEVSTEWEAWGPGRFLWDVGTAFRGLKQADIVGPALSFRLAPPGLSSVPFA